MAKWAPVVTAWIRCVAAATRLTVSTTGHAALQNKVKERTGQNSKLLAVNSASTITSANRRPAAAYTAAACQGRRVACSYEAVVALVARDVSAMVTSSKE